MSPPRHEALCTPPHPTPQLCWEGRNLIPPGSRPGRRRWRKGRCCRRALGSGDRRVMDAALAPMSSVPGPREAGPAGRGCLGRGLPGLGWAARGRCGAWRDARRSGAGSVALGPGKPRGELAAASRLPAPGGLRLVVLGASGHLHDGLARRSRRPPAPGQEKLALEVGSAFVFSQGKVKEVLASVIELEEHLQKHFL